MWVSSQSYSHMNKIKRSISILVLTEQYQHLIGRGTAFIQREDKDLTTHPRDRSHGHCKRDDLSRPTDYNSHYHLHCVASRIKCIPRRGHSDRFYWARDIISISPKVLQLPSNQASVSTFLINNLCFDAFRALWGPSLAAYHDFQVADVRCLVLRKSDNSESNEAYEVVLHHVSYLTKECEC